MKNPVAVPMGEDDDLLVDAVRGCKRCRQFIVMYGCPGGITWESAVAEGQELSNEQEAG